MKWIAFLVSVAGLSLTAVVALNPSFFVQRFSHHEQTPVAAISIWPSGVGLPSEDARDLLVLIRAANREPATRARPARSE